MPAEDRDQQEIERDIERRVQELGRLINESESERSDELRQMASSLLMQQKPAQETHADQERKASIRRPLNPLALGLFFAILGCGFFFLLPPTGLVLIFGGLAGVLWGWLADSIPGRTILEKDPESKD